MDSPLQDLNLVLDELLHELAHLVLRDFSRLVVTENCENVVVLTFKVRVGKAFPLVTTKEPSRHVLYDVTLEHARAIFVHGEEQIPVDFFELF